MTRMPSGQCSFVGAPDLDKTSSEGPQEVPPDLHVRAVPPTFDEIYEQYVDMVWCAARRLGTPEANIDDVVQDVFLALHRRLPDYTGRGSLRSWIFGFVLRVVRDHRRTFRRKDAHCIPLTQDEDAEVPVASSNPEPCEVAERNEAFALLGMLLDQLEPEKRELLVMSELEEMTVREIADVLGSNTNTTYSRLRVARKAFDDAHARHLARTSRRGI